MVIDDTKTAVTMLVFAARNGLNTFMFKIKYFNPFCESTVELRPN